MKQPIVDTIARMKKLIPMLILLLAACSPASTVQPTRIDTATALIAPTLTPAFTATASGSPTATLMPTPVPLTVCSPLAGMDLQALMAALVNPYDPPEIGSERVHQGVDFAEIDPINHNALEGLVIQAVLPGMVRMVTHDRQPYGNAIIIETPLDALSQLPEPEWAIPTALPALLNLSTLTCPMGKETVTYATEARSLYLLYAHMQAPSGLAVGEEVTSCQQIGQVGMTGYALNPHVHIEVRVGPSSAVFPEMSHYAVSASEAEMANYCLWRVSGLFQFIDPLIILNLMEKP